MTTLTEERRGYKTGIFLAILAAALYALNAPLSKILLDYLPSTLTAGFLYIGAGLGMGAVALMRKARGTSDAESRLTRAELPYTIAMVALDIAAPILLMYGLKSTSAASASLLNNFEIVATALVALIVFKERISGSLWLGIAAVTASCLILSFEDFSGGVRFSYGALFVLLACVCWGFENNCTRKISSKDPMQIVLIKGVFSGGASVIIGFCIGERITVVWSVFAVLAVGFVAYGLSIFFYVYAQRRLGAARTGAYYAVAPFIGTVLSLIIFKELPHYTYFIALAVMLVGAWLCTSDTPILKSLKDFTAKLNGKSAKANDGEADNSDENGLDGHENGLEKDETDLKLHTLNGGSASDGNDPSRGTSHREDREQTSKPYKYANQARNGDTAENQHDYKK